MTALTQRRRILRSLAAIGTSLCLMAPAVAQTGPAWPTKTIRLVVPFPPGGATDMAARTIGQKLSERLQQSVVVENRAGASGSIAATQVVRAEPDGYTLMMLGTPTLMAPLLYKSVTYDPAKDLSSIATMYDIPLVLVVNPSLLAHVKDLASFTAHVKAQKAPLHYTTAGIGSFGHLSMELLKQMAGLELQHVPQKGAAPAVTDVVGGQVPVMFADLNAVLPHIRSGSLRAIGVASEQRVSLLPDVKTIAEQGIGGYNVTAWGGLQAPNGVPKHVADRLTNEIEKILADGQVQERLLGAALFANFENGERMRQRIQQDFAQWGPLIQKQRIALD